MVKALDRQHDRFVALKIRRSATGDAREELLGEARILLAVSPHPALPLVREDFFEGDSYVVAMDWVDGINLATLLRDRGRPGLAPSSVLAYLAQAAEALTHLHSPGPAGDPRRREAGEPDPDQGRARQARRLRHLVGTATRRGAARALPGFRAPELAADGLPSRASDVYALAATAFALLTGAPPSGLLPDMGGHRRGAGRAARGRDPAGPGHRSRPAGPRRPGSSSSGCGPAGARPCRRAC